MGFILMVKILSPQTLSQGTMTKVFDTKDFGFLCLLLGQSEQLKE